MAATAAQCNALTTYFIKMYSEKYGNAPVVNRNIARSQFSNMMLDLSTDEVKELIEYYFTTAGSKDHNITWFFYNYDKLIIGRSSQVVEADQRQKLREESKQRVKEWRARGRHGITEDGS